MNFRELNEDIPNFADRAEATLNDVGNLAKKALSGFKGAKDNAKNELSAEAKAAAEAEEQDRLNKNKGVQDAMMNDASAMLADIVISSQPEENDLPTLESLDAEQFNTLQLALDKMIDRIENFTAVFLRELQNASFVRAVDRKGLSARLGSQKDAAVTEASDNMLASSKNGEREVWTAILTSDKPELPAKDLIGMIEKIQARNTKINLSLVSQNNNSKKTLAEGLNLINMAAAQQSILQKRLGMLKPILVKLANKSVKKITTEQLKRVGILAKLLNS
jgi:hypothetical protein